MKDLTRGNHDAFGCWIQFWHTRKWHALIHNDQNPFLHETEYKASTIYFLFPLHLFDYFSPQFDITWTVHSHLITIKLWIDQIQYSTEPFFYNTIESLKPSPFIYMKFFLKRSIMLLTFLFRVNVRTLLIHSFIFASW